MYPYLLKLWLAGLFAGLLELLWLQRHGSLFLSSREHWTAGVAVLLCMAGVVSCAGLLTEVFRRGLDRISGGDWNARVSGGLVACVLAASGWSLSAGRRLRDQEWRPFVVLAVALLGAWLAVRVLRWLDALRLEHASATRRRVLLALPVLAGGALLLDSLVLPRSYPALHLLLSLLSLSACVAFAWLWTKPDPGASIMKRAALVLTLLICAAPLALWRLHAAPNASFVVSSHAPWTGKLLVLLPDRGQDLLDSSARMEVAVPEFGLQKLPGEGISLIDADVLWITVDALRADVVGSGRKDSLTPAMDALGAEGVVFQRAYTPTPHTSYALSSLMSGRFLRHVFDLDGAVSDALVTLPDLLRRHGYRTAAFYPPAIFFVDGQRFESLRERGLGFEYRKAMFASARERVGQLSKYLDTMSGGAHPLFVWVHLFEPHEPYDPDPSCASGEDARSRYDGEVRCSDRAVGDLVRLFRERRPGATVVLSADHGEEFGEHGGQFHGTTLHDEQVRVPLIWSSPGAVRPGVVQAPVELVDLPTTLLLALGVPPDARMQGDDLGPLLAGSKEGAPSHAFATVGNEHMVTDGEYKAICSVRQPVCRLYDLEADPGEQHNLAQEQPARAAQLRLALSRFLGQIPDRELLALDNEHGWPEALAQLRLGVPDAAPRVVPLLADGRPAIRSSAARALGRARFLGAAVALDRLRLRDPDPLVRGEAALATQLLGKSDAREQLLELMRGPPVDGERHSGVSLERRSALALSSGVEDGVLSKEDAARIRLHLEQTALDDLMVEESRLAAIEGLADLGEREAVPVLLGLLGEVRLRPSVARALGRLGGKRARLALRQALSGERYPAAREAEARALLALGDRASVATVREMLGNETSLPGGVAILRQFGDLGNPSARGAEIADPRVRGGDWQCDGLGCRPGSGARLRLPGVLPSSDGHLGVLEVHCGSSRCQFQVKGLAPQELGPGAGQVVFSLDVSSALDWALGVKGDLKLRSIAVVPVRPDVPAPAPEPWQEGVPPGVPESGASGGDVDR